MHRFRFAQEKELKEYIYISAAFMILRSRTFNMTFTKAH